MTRLLRTAQPFTPEQLRLLERSLDPALRSWAVDNPSVRAMGEEGEENRLIKDLAAVHTLGRALLARGRLHDFQFAVTLGHNLGALYEELHGRSPKEMAGTAAGQLAVAKLLTVWYGLQSEDLARLHEPKSALEFAGIEAEGLQEAVCTVPQTLGISTFTARDVYLETRFEAEEAVGTAGAPALEQYTDFPQFPIT